MPRALFKFSTLTSDKWPVNQDVKSLWKTFYEQASFGDVSSPEICQNSLLFEGCRRLFRVFVCLSVILQNCNGVGSFWSGFGRRLKPCSSRFLSGIRVQCSLCRPVVRRLHGSIASNFQTLPFERAKKSIFTKLSFSCNILFVFYQVFYRLSRNWDLHKDIQCLGLDLQLSLRQSWAQNWKLHSNGSESDFKSQRV